MGALSRPAWTWDFLSTPAYTYALLDQDVPAETLSSFVTEQMDPTLRWDDIKWLKQEWGGPVVIKGVVRPDDAKRAVEEAGFDGVWVKNCARFHEECSKLSSNDKM